MPARIRRTPYEAALASGDDAQAAIWKRLEAGGLDTRPCALGPARVTQCVRGWQAFGWRGEECGGHQQRHNACEASQRAVLAGPLPRRHVDTARTASGPSRVIVWSIAATSPKLLRIAPRLALCSSSVRVAQPSASITTL